jgi:hypothetical protein
MHAGAGPLMRSIRTLDTYAGFAMAIIICLITQPVILSVATNYAGPFLYPLTIRTSAGKLIPLAVEYSL